MGGREQASGAGRQQGSAARQAARQGHTITAIERQLLLPAPVFSCDRSFPLVTRFLSLFFVCVQYDLKPADEEGQEEGGEDEGEGGGAAGGAVSSSSSSSTISEIKALLEQYR